MRITEALVSTAALLVLGSMPLSAEAQCGVAYGDYGVNEVEGTIDAWSYVEEYVIPECPWYNAYQYGYYEHIYSVTAQITGPTQNVAYNEGGSVMPYGGGNAGTFTSLSYIDDPGEYIVDWFIGVFCTLGGPLGQWIDDTGIGIALFEIARHTTASLTESEVDSFFLDATELLWTIDGEDDVACPILFLRNGSIDVFTEGDGTINNQQQRDDVIAVPGLAKVVREINWCNGGPPATGHSVGCSAGAGMILVRTTPSLEGSLWAHEYGHNQDLWLVNNHYPDPNFLGYYLQVPTARRVTQFQCDMMRVQN